MRSNRLCPALAPTLACALAAGLACAPALADPVLIRIEGVLTSGGFATGPFAGEGAGASFVFEWMLDSAATDTASSPDVGVFASTGAFTLTIGSSGIAGAPASAPVSWYGVYDNWGGSASDVLRVRLYHADFELFALNLVDHQGDVFSDEDFTTDFSLGDFESRIGYFGNQGIAFFEVTSIAFPGNSIPLPSATALACAGFAGLMIRRRRA